MQPLNRNTNPKRFESIRLNASLADDQYPPNRWSYPFSNVAQDTLQTAEKSMSYAGKKIVRTRCCSLEIKDSRWSMMIPGLCG